MTLQHQDIITRFYEAFHRLDGQEMGSLYHDDVLFEDPAFGQLKGEEARQMWLMLCDSQKGRNFKVEASSIFAEGNSGKAHWEAYYRFSQTNRKVHNIIDAQFEFKDGLIIKHTDTFNLYHWARQALGFKGLVFGWTGFFKRKLNQQTRQLLNRFKHK